MNYADKCSIKQNEKLSLSIKIYYGIGDIGNALINSSVQFFLLVFYTDVALIGPALAGSALIVAKMWDAINDPVFGCFSDNVNSRFGKRRIFMIVGAIPLAFATALLWFVPAIQSPLLLFGWIALSYIIWDSLWTITNVPYYALSGELTEDYDERSDLTTWRMIFAVPAFITGAALTPVIVDCFENKRMGYLSVGIIFGLVTAISLIVSALNLKEKKKKVTSKEVYDLLEIGRNVCNNRPFLQLVAAYGVCNLGFALIRTFMAYALIYLFDMRDKVPLVMFMLLATVAIFLVPWKIVATKIGKGPSYAIGLVITGIAMIATFFLPAKESSAVYIIALIAGIGFSANWVFPWAMLPDVVEYDRLHSGKNRSGLYFGIWGFVFKISELLGIAITGWVLQLFNYIPNVEQSDFTLLGIRLFFGPVSAFLILVSAPLLFWYPITRKSHQEIRLKIQDTIASL